MNKTSVLFGIGGLIIGLILGFFISNSINRNALSQQSLAQNPTEASLFNQPTQNTGVKPQSNGVMIPDVAETLDTANKEPENFEAQMKAGDLYMQIQGFEKAAGFYDNAAALKPTEYEKIARLGNAYFDIRQFEKAESFYLQAIEKKPDDINVRTDLGITYVERPNPDYDRAIKEFQASLNINPKHEPTLFNLALAYFKKGDAENARKFMTQLEQANPKSQLIERLSQTISQKQQENAK